MFLKPFKIKSHSQLRTTERKAFSEKLAQRFPNLNAQHLEFDILPKSASVTVTKIETSSAKQVQVYVINRTPLFFFLDDTFFPTIFLLWRYPDFVLPFTTHIPVIAKLLDGADLMLPGVVHPTSSSSSLDAPFLSGTIVYVNSTANKAAYAVGATVLASQDLVNSKGKAVKIYHVYGDKLCSLDQQCPPVPEFGPPVFLQPLFDVLSINEENSAVSSSSNVEESATVVRETIEVATTPANLSDEADRLLLHCFYSAIKGSKDAVLPILISTFYKVHMLSKCPSDRVLDIKKTTYKKLGNFLNKMAESKIIKVEESKKGVFNIVEIDRKHPLIMEYRPDSDYSMSNEVKEEDDAAQPSVIESHSVTASVLPIFCNFGLSKGDVIENANIRKYIIEYVKKLNLQDEREKDYVILNPTLKNIFGQGPKMSFQTLISQTYQKMTPCFKITCGSKEIFRKGKLETINISIAKRSGNKKITLVDNVEFYGIDISELSTYCRKGVAASATINRSQVPNKTDQLQIQGNQVLFIHNILTEKYKVPKRYINGLEFAPKKKN